MKMIKSVPSLAANVSIAVNESKNFLEITSGVYSA
jgi:hypothetical protein